MDYKKIRLTTESGVATLTLNDPGTLNAAGLDLTDEMAHAFRSLAAGIVPARAVIVTGEGRGFCSGANLSAGGAAGREPDVDGKPDAGRALETTYNPLITLMRDFPLPIVTAVNGAAAGIGCSIALMGDIIVAGESAFFLQAFRRIGLVPDGGSTYLLPRMIGRARAMEMALLGEKVPARTALEWGLVNRCVPDAELMATATDLANQLANGPKSLAIIRRLMWEALDNDWQAQLQAERIGQRTAGKTEDFIEGVTAFMQKRQASFKGA
ncbi:MAG TPA: enoyl-CoA hydratase/isomerase [Caulobacteraceae bacterium]|nr:enoyl-CoA hydratase/isomerase [Caulobacteraceae bacterium]